MDVKTLLLTTLESFNYPVYLQGSLSDKDAYPDAFFTYWNNYTDDEAFYDNTEHQVIWNFD